MRLCPKNEAALDDCWTASWRHYKVKRKTFFFFIIVLKWFFRCINLTPLAPLFIYTLVNKKTTTELGSGISLSSYKSTSELFMKSIVHFEPMVRSYFLFLLCSGKKIFFNIISVFKENITR